MTDEREKTEVTEAVDKPLPTVAQVQQRLADLDVELVKRIEAINKSAKENREVVDRELKDQGDLRKGRIAAHAKESRDSVRRKYKRAVAHWNRVLRGLEAEGAATGGAE